MPSDMCDICFPQGKLFGMEAGFWRKRLPAFRGAQPLRGLTAYMLSSLSACTLQVTVTIARRVLCTTTLVAGLPFGWLNVWTFSGKKCISRSSLVESFALQIVGPHAFIIAAPAWHVLVQLHKWQPEPVHLSRPRVLISH